MIEIIKQDDKILQFEATNTLTHVDYERVLMPELEKVIKKYGKARILFAMGEEFHGWEPSAMWDDAKFGIRHRTDFEKCAVVGGPKWVQWATKLGSLLITAECKSFSANELQQAQSWIEAP